MAGTLPTRSRARRGRLSLKESYYRARYYDPGRSRFLSEDPIGISGGINLYPYVANNPMRYADPSGLIEWPFDAPTPWNDNAGWPMAERSDGRNTWVNPIIYWRSFGQGTRDLWTLYWKMREANTIGADHYFHCLANCQAARRGQGGYDASEVITEVRELVDEYIKRDSPQACQADRDANQQGRNGDPTQSCYRVCDSLRPRGLHPSY